MYLENFIQIKFSALQILNQNFKLNSSGPKHTMVCQNIHLKPAKFLATTQKLIQNQTLVTPTNNQQLKTIILIKILQKLNLA